MDKIKLSNSQNRKHLLKNFRKKNTYMARCFPFTENINTKTFQTHILCVYIERNIGTKHHSF